MILMERIFISPIDETIKNHLITKSKIAINISGGLDSNIILHHSLKYKPDIDLFCTYFEKAQMNIIMILKLHQKFLNYMV